MVHLLLLAALRLSPLPAPPAAPVAAGEPDLVILIHGLGRTRLSMLPMERALEREGFEVLNWGYGSTTDSVAGIGAALAASVDSALAAVPGRRVHFVGHSLGNIVVRWMLANRGAEGIGRVVMLAPPNQGSRYADRFAPWLGWLLRPLPELTTAGGSTVRSLPAPEGVEFAIIAGAEDGKVRVEETRLEGAAEHAVVPAGHTFIMARDDVRRLVVEFLRTGGWGDGEEGGPRIREPVAVPGGFSRPAAEPRLRRSRSAVPARASGRRGPPA